MKRRHCLTLLGAGIGSVAGCTGPSSSGPTTASSTPTGTTTPDATRVPVGRSVTVGGVSRTVSNPRVRKGILAAGVHDPRLVATAGQYVVVDVTVDGEPPKRVDDGTLRSWADGEALPDGNAMPMASAGMYGLPFPVERYDAAAIEWLVDGEPVRWTLPAGVRQNLAAEPRFDIEAFRIPRRDGRLVLELTVANRGERDGRFVAEVSMESFSGNGVVDFSVPAGESRTYTGRADKMLLYFENNGGGTLTVRYPGDDGVVSVERTREVSTATATNGTTTTEDATTESFTHSFV